MTGNKTEKALKRSENLLNTIASNFPGGFFVLFDNQLRQIIIGGSDYNPFGTALDDIRGKLLEESFPGEVIGIIKPVYERAILGFKAEREFSYYNKTYFVHSFPVKKETGEIYGGIAVFQNISARTAFEAKAKRAIGRFVSMIESITDGFISLDNSLTVKYVNKNAERIIKKNRNQLIAKSFGIGFPELETTAFYRSILDSRNRKEPVRFEEFISTFDAWIEGNCFPESDGITIYFKDISDRKKSEEQLIRSLSEIKNSKRIIETYAKELSILNEKLTASELELKKLNQDKDKFFSIISHDLRSPFTSILGLSNLFYEDYDRMSDDQVREGLENINESAKVLLNLLENLLHWSRIQLGKIDFIPESFDLRELIQEAFIIFKGNAERKKISLINEINPSTEVFSDYNAFTSVIQNILSNGIKFTDTGGSVKVKSFTKGQVEIISVIDNGRGIKKEDLEKLFKLDTHFSTAGTQKEKGSGLGLLLSRELLEKNGGRISVESTPGSGTTVVIEIPKAMNPL